MKFLNRTAIQCGITLCLACLITILCAKSFRVEDIRVELVTESPQIINYQLVYHNAEAAISQESDVQKRNLYIHQPELLQFPIPAKRIDSLHLQVGKAALNGDVIVQKVQINGEELPLQKILAVNEKTHDIKWTGNRLRLNGEAASMMEIPVEAGGYLAQRHYQWFSLISVFFIAVLAVWAILFLYFSKFYYFVGGQESMFRKNWYFYSWWLSF